MHGKRTNGAIVYLLHRTLTGYSNWSTHISVNVLFVWCWWGYAIITCSSCSSPHGVSVGRSAFWVKHRVCWCLCVCGGWTGWVRCYIYTLWVCVCFRKWVWALSGSLCCNFPSGTQKPQYPSTAAAVPSPSHVGVLCRCSKWGREEME